MNARSEDDEPDPPASRAVYALRVLKLLLTVLILALTLWRAVGGGPL